MEQQLAQAPTGSWRQAVCSYGLVVDLMQGCEQALRSAGLHVSGDQLFALRRHFLANARSPALQGDEPPLRQRQTTQMPIHRQSRRRRRLPQLRD